MKLHESLVNEGKERGTFAITWIIKKAVAKNRRHFTRMMRLGQWTSL
jgi:hypothetical protein